MIRFTNRVCRLFLIFMAALMVFSGGAGAAQEVTVEQLRALLQQSLTITEIDRELARLGREEVKLNARIAATRAQIKVQQTKLTASKARAAEVLRTYYYGDRDLIWVVLFSAKSFNDLLHIFETLQMIYSNDMQRLRGYQKEVQVLQTIETRQAEEKQTLSDNRRQFREQRARIIKLEALLESKLAAFDDAERVRKQLAQFTNEWQTRGLPMFSAYLSAMAKAVPGMPQYIMDKKQFKGNSFSITEEQFNEYLRSQNERFRNITVRFREQRVEMSGTDSGISMYIKGRYEIVNEPQNAIVFQIEQLKYQDYLLPAETIRDLEQRFDLSIVPKEIISFIEATSIDISNGNMTIKVRITLN